MLLDESKTGAWQNWRYRAIEQTVNFRGLREVRNLCRAAVIGNCRQQVILHDGAQRYVGTEALRLSFGPRGQFCRGISVIVLCRFGLIGAGAVSRQRLARAVVVMQKKRK